MLPSARSAPLHRCNSRVDYEALPICQQQEPTSYTEFPNGVTHLPVCVLSPRPRAGVNSSSTGRRQHYYTIRPFPPNNVHSGRTHVSHRAKRALFPTQSQLTPDPRLTVYPSAADKISLSSFCALSSPSPYSVFRRPVLNRPSPIPIQIEIKVIPTARAMMNSPRPCRRAMCLPLNLVLRPYVIITAVIFFHSSTGCPSRRRLYHGAMNRVWIVC